MNPDQTAPLGPFCLQNISIRTKDGEIKDDKSRDWREKGYVMP